MAGAHDRFQNSGSRVRTARLVVALVLCSFTATCGVPDVSKEHGRTRAEALASAWARHEGVPDRKLDAAGDLPLGESGLAYDAASNVLFARFWINMARTDGAPPERIAIYRRMEQALNDPAIGGMYERANGYFVLDEKRKGFFLVRPFNVDSTTPEMLVSAMERAQAVSARWTTQWFGEVAMIMHGNRPAPRQPVPLPD